MLEKSRNLIQGEIYKSIDKKLKHKSQHRFIYTNLERTQFGLMIEINDIIDELRSNLVF